MDVRRDASAATTKPTNTVAVTKTNANTDTVTNTDTDTDTVTKTNTGVVAAWPPGTKRSECDRNVALAAAIVERVSGYESYGSYVTNELRVGVKDAVRGGRPSSFRNAYAALAETATKTKTKTKTKNQTGEGAFGDGVRAGRYVVELRDAGDGERALVRRGASRRAEESPEEGNESAGESRSVTPLGGAWLTAWEMRRTLLGLLTPGGTLARTEASANDLMGDVAFRWHGVDGAFDAYGSGFVSEVTASGLRRRPTTRFDSAGSRLSGSRPSGAQPSTAVYASLGRLVRRGLAARVVPRARDRGVDRVERRGVGWGGGGRSFPRRAHALKMHGPGEGPGGQPRFAELVLSMFVDDFIPGLDDSSTRGGEGGGDSPGGDSPGGDSPGGDSRAGRGGRDASRLRRRRGRVARVDGWPRRGSGGLRIRTDLPGYGE